MLPKITIGVTCFNAATTIQRALASALAQVWPDFEILVVDDCSTDNSVELIQSMMVGHSRIRLITHKANTGVGGARQTLVSNASGAFIAFFDDDDESMPERLAVQYQRIVDYETTSQLEFIGCYASGQRRYPNGYIKEIIAIGSREEIPASQEVARYLLYNAREPEKFFGSGTPASALMARKACIEKVGGFDKDFRRVEDVDFAIRLALMGGHFIGCKERLYIQHATKGTDKTPTANLTSELRLTEKHKDFLIGVKRYQYSRAWFKFRAEYFARNPIRAILALAVCWVINPLETTTHFLRSAPRRFIHEIRMGKSR